MSAPESWNRLPASVVARKLVAQGADMRGVIPPQDFERLAAAQAIVLEPVVVSLQFGGTDRAEKVVTGSVNARVSLQCERCLERFATPLDVDFAVAVVWNEEEAAQLPADLDPWLVADDSADLIALAEDELLLALPIVALHPVGEQCNAPAMSYGAEPKGGEPELSETGQEDNPFRILEQLKNRSGKE